MIAETSLPQIEFEFGNTHKMLERVPEEFFSWKPHEKSMTVLRLATHIATLPEWLTIAVSTPELDVSKSPYAPPKFETTEEIVKAFDKNAKDAVEAMKGASDETLLAQWTLRKGERIISAMPRIAVIRGMVLSHMIHHRAQLGVFLRLLDVPIPGMYGPSADEMN